MEEHQGTQRLQIGFNGSQRIIVTYFPKIRRNLRRRVGRGYMSYASSIVQITWGHVGCGESKKQDGIQIRTVITPTMI